VAQWHVAYGSKAVNSGSRADVRQVPKADVPVLAQYHAFVPDTLSSAMNFMTKAMK
jgi:hypothetical protein